jgi:hypothetical protein
MTNTIVVGSGKTSRANIEALMSDYYTANKNVTVYILAFEEPSDAQVWVEEHARSLEITVEYARQYPRLDDADLLILWDDTNPESLEALQMAKKRNWPVYDLIDGLCSIPYPQTDVEIEEPEIPVEEIIEEEDEDDEDDELYNAFLIVAEYIADLVAEKTKGRRK